MYIRTISADRLPAMYTPSYPSEPPNYDERPVGRSTSHRTVSAAINRHQSVAIEDPWATAPAANDDWPF
ncbi:MAG: hypothetical protein M3Y35_10340 [Actinomycetota bacterium]|nr:hypothetical protein [Actinomycetota bacterium]